LKPRQRHDLTLTGERTLPGIWHENYWFQRHVAAYEYAHSLGLGPVLLEAGCGEGYGAELLRHGGKYVVAVDYDMAAVGHVRHAYPRLMAVRANLVALPFRERSVDAIVSLQTLEHLWDQDAFLAESIRVLRPRGALVLSTPNRLTFSPDSAPSQKPRNPFHTKELDPGELTRLLARHGAITSMAGLRHGARISRWEASHGDLVQAQLDRPYPDWDRGVAAFVRSLTALDFTTSSEDLPTSLDLIAVVTRDTGLVTGSADRP